MRRTCKVHLIFILTALFTIVFSWNFKAVVQAAGEAVGIDATNFPDGKFRSFVSENYDQNRDGYLSDDEISDAKEMNVFGKEISSLKGIEYFTALEILNCGNNKLESLDVSRNTALEKLGCAENRISSLDLSKNTSLQYLYCNSNRIKSFDVSNNSVLISLSCGTNQLSSLDLSKNKALKYFYCSDNKLTVKFTKEGFSVEGLDVSRMSDLTGGKIAGGLIVPDAGAVRITYTYDVGNMNVENPGFSLLAEGHEHTFGTEWKSNEHSHWHECTCGEKSDMTTHTPGAAASCTTDQTCTVCGRVLVNASGHTFGTEWKLDENSHWHACECGEKIDVAEHTLITDVTQATLKREGKHETKCFVCQKVTKTEIIPTIKTVTLSRSTYVYDGKVKSPTLIVKDSSGRTITSKYYTVKKAPGRKNVGRYSYKITFKGNYKGTKTLTFAINPKGTKISSLVPLAKGFTVNWARQTKQITGYQVQYSLKSDMKGAKLVTINKNNILTKTVKKLQANKTYYVQIRTYKTSGGKKYYSEWSKTRTVKTKK